MTGSYALVHLGFHADIAARSGSAEARSGLSEYYAPCSARFSAAARRRRIRFRSDSPLHQRLESLGAGCGTRRRVFRHVRSRAMALREFPDVARIAQLVFRDREIIHTLFPRHRRGCATSLCYTDRHLPSILDLDGDLGDGSNIDDARRTGVGRLDAAHPPMNLPARLHSRNLTRQFTRLAFLAIGVILLAAAPLGAHVGSPDVFYEGLAGPYHLYVTVRVPQVIPGVAEIEVRSESNDVHSIQVVPLRLTGQGSSVAPVPDLAQQSKDDPQFFTGSLWLMETGALQVRVLVDGARGKGELSVPVPSYAQTVLPMEKPLEGVMIVLLLVLTIGIISIVGAGAREAKLDPGARTPSNNFRRAEIIMVITAILVVGAVYLGRSWWDSEAADYQRNVNYYKPPRAETELKNGNGLIITAAGNDPNWSRNVDMKEVIPDHGHLMHLFLISTDGMKSMWHLHPDRIADDRFAVAVHLLPAGHYQIFADIVDRRGFPWTLIGEIDLTGGLLRGPMYVGT